MLNCEPRECQCTWTDWSKWSDCSVTCGSGTKYRTRNKINQNKPGCTGDDKEIVSCTTVPCPNCRDYTGTIFLDKAVVNSTLCEECTCDYDKIVCNPKNTNISEYE